MIRVLIVDDSVVVRKGLTTLIGGERDMEVYGEAANGPMALASLKDHPTVDIVLTDFNMPGMDGVELTEKIKRSHSNAKVIVLTMHRQSAFRDKAIAAGAMGYLLKGEDEQELFEAIRVVHSGGTFVSEGFPL